MALSKSRRIQLLLLIDALFFLLEITIGYAVHSLALVADSFHMLNDVLSLCVGLWAVKVAGSKTKSKMYTYGWQRAETLGALVNGVFLVALCMSIGLEAIQRFFEPQEVSHPKLVLIVGCCGLASNIFGLFLFHDHGHSHGGHSHGHSHEESNGISHNHDHADPIKNAEEGRKSLDDTTEAIANESGNVQDVLPQTVVKKFDQTQAPKPSRINFEQSSYNISSPKSATSRQSKRAKSRSFSTLEGISGHPASFRNDIIAASKINDQDEASVTDTDFGDDTINDEETAATSNERTPLLTPTRSTSHSNRSKSINNGRLHNTHKHSRPVDGSKKAGGHGHSHADLNMRGVFLHVMGDALGNIGVIATALFIWLTKYSWRFYTDPIISLVITVIILTSAIPLCKAASRILLQAVPMGLNVDDIKDDVAALPGVLGVHHLHVWQLSDTKLVASLHVRIEFEFKGEGSERYMQLARQIRRCLHGYSIHSSTIQPEFRCEAVLRRQAKRKGPHSHVSRGVHYDHSEDDSCYDQDTSSDITADYSDPARGCLLDCDDECGDGGKCCVISGDAID